LPHEGGNDSELNIGQITGRNEMILRIIKQTDKILEASLPAGHPLQEQLSDAIHSYCMAIKLLNSHYLLSEYEIEQF